MNPLHNASESSKRKYLYSKPYYIQGTLSSEKSCWLQGGKERLKGGKRRRSTNNSLHEYRSCFLSLNLKGKIKY